MLGFPFRVFVSTREVLVGCSPTSLDVIEHISVIHLLTSTEELTSSAKLIVTPSKEPLFTRKLDILEVIEGRTARFDCKVSGSPAPRVTWMHFGKNLKAAVRCSYIF